MSKITLRPIRTSDLESLVQNANDPLVANNMADLFPHPYTIQDGRDFIEMVRSDKKAYRLAIIFEDKLVGMIGLHFMQDIFRINAEIGYWIGSNYWGKGIASEVIPQMVEIGFETFEINRIFGRVFGTNVGSQRVLEKSGFKLEAKFEKTLIKGELIHDEFIFAIRRT